MLSLSVKYPFSIYTFIIILNPLFFFVYLAALTLKTYVTTHWSSKNDDKFVGPEAPPESKAAVREIILNGLADPESKIRVVSAYVVSKIAHDDFPEDWPNLFDILLSYLKSNSADSVHGAMHVLLEMVKKDISIQQLPQIGPVLIPEMYRILTSDNVYSFSTRGRAVNILTSCIEMLSTLREENPALAEQFIAPIIPQWMEAFVIILNHHVQGDDEKATEEYGLKMKVVKCICTISAEFPKYISSLLPQLFEPIWMDLYNLRERYVEEFVSDSGDIGESYQDSEGNEIGFQHLLYVLFDFVAAACTKKTVRHLFMNADGTATGFFEQLLYVYIIYMQITQEQIETWSSDANQFVADEEDGTFTFNARVASIDVLLTLQEAFPIPFFNALSAAIQRHISESNEARNAGNGDWWKIQESCLLAVGRLSEELADSLADESKKVQFDLKSLFDHVVLEDMKLSDLPFLQGRAFVFASEFAKILPNDMSSQYVSVAVQALQSPNSGIPVKISALRALDNYCKYLNPQFVTPYQVNIMEGACQLLPLATEESLMLLLDTLASAIKINQEVTAKYEHILTPAILQLWEKNATDSIITSYILDLFEEFAKNTFYYSSLCARALPFIGQVLSTANTNPIVYSSAVDLLTAMISFGPSPLPNEFTEQMFPGLMQLAWNVPDIDLLQSTQECLKTFINKDADHIMRWHDPSGKSGLDYIILFIAKLLEPTGSDSDAIFVGDLIVTLIQKVGNGIAPVLPNLLTAVLGRLMNTDYQPFIQSLVMVFAHLIISQQDTVFQFLCDAQINGKNGLEILMTTWCDNYDSFSGYYTMKVSAVALSKVFLSSDPRLQSISVKGDIVVNPNAGIVTRSRAKRNPDQYQTISVPTKIIKLLIADATTAYMNEQAPIEDAESVDEDETGDWEDVDDDPFTARNDFHLLSDMLNNLDENDDEEDNPDLKNDPIYQTDMKTYLTDFFRNCNTHNVNNFNEICQIQLNLEEKQILEHILRQ
ncbi:armadillo-type protein [Cokeromyces recurvatus]|uniref:armadillo-type protein n=1 Tax=Cokeromyces recurvatus TaxID=90255 RepID=UPI00221EC6A3|nr:armadillo-type protein [Cokeromyces recurvatus]KAI7903140.1 armadillo-type protein [Cokeromyces recurvatus]